MKNCGKRFHQEIGKFRFLNEIIKVVSPKVRPNFDFSVKTLLGSFRRSCLSGNKFQRIVQWFCCPQYLGAHTTEKVKKKCIEILYSWTLGLKHETKILEAYSMLKRQAIVKEDPVHVEKVSYFAMHFMKRKVLSAWVRKAEWLLLCMMVMKKMNNTANQETQTCGSSLPASSVLRPKPNISWRVCA